MHVISAISVGADGVKLGDVNGDGLLDLAVGWEEGGVTTVHLHPGYGAAHSRWPTVIVGTTPSVEDATFADIDGDGRLEVFSFTEGDDKSVYISRPPADVARVLTASAWQQEIIPVSRDRMMWMFGSPTRLRTGGDMVLLAGGKDADAEIGWFQRSDDGSGPPEWTWNPISKVGWLMSLWSSDMDGDGDIDVVLTDRYGPQRGVRWLENPGHDTGDQRTWPCHFIGAGTREVMDMALADIDGDGLEDAVVAINDGELVWFRRGDSSGLTWRLEDIPL
jgi:hypothetical protein